MYIENNLCDGLYNNNHVDLLKVLTSQMAISLENIRFLHDQMEKQSEQLRYSNQYLK
jgi:histidine kinase